MRAARFDLAARIALALAVSALATYLLWSAGPLATVVALFIALAVLLFVALAIIAASRRVPSSTRLGQGRRGGGRFRGNGWDTSGTREPRRPYPPFFPPRAAAAEPEDVALPEG